MEESHRKYAREQNNERRQRSSNDRDERLEARPAEENVTCFQSSVLLVWPKKLERAGERRGSFQLFGDVICSSFRAKIKSASMLTDKPELGKC